MLQNLLNTTSINYNAVTKVSEEIGKYVTYAIQGVCALLVILFVVYAVYVGFRLAKSENQNARNDARQHLLYAIVGILVAAATFGLLTAVDNTILGLKVYEGNTSGGTSTEPVDIQYQAMMKAFVSIVKVVLKIAYAGAGLFAFILGWNVMKSDNESKRGEARKQIIWAAIAMVGAVGLYVVAQAALGLTV